MSRWFDETLHAAYRQGFLEGAVLHDSGTAHQRLRLFENPVFGRVLTLDGAVQVTTGDEFCYHEMMAHVPLLAHGAARRVLVIGGGDGGIAREALKHPGVERLVMVEIDAGVIEFSRAFLPTVSAGAFDDPRLEVVIADGAEYVARAGESFDAILVDSTDPVGPGEALFTDTFYGRAKRRLAPGGILVTQNGVPFLQPDELRGSMRAFRALFADAACFLAHVPSYAGGPMALGWGTDGGSRETPEAVLAARLSAAGIAGLRAYTPATHRAAFALPGYVAALVGPERAENQPG